MFYKYVILHHTSTCILHNLRVSIERCQRTASRIHHTTHKVLIVIFYLACRTCCYICSRPIINFLIGDHTLFEFMAITYMLQAMFLPATLIHITQQLDCNSCMTRSCNSRRSFEPRSINTNANNAGSKS